jgi:excisionase family DNA binding protein
MRLHIAQRAKPIKALQRYMGLLIHCGMEDGKKKTGKSSLNYALRKRLYSIKDASVYLGRSVWAVREMLWAGKIPYIKDGKRILLDIQDMDTWIQRNKTQFAF